MPGTIGKRRTTGPLPVMAKTVLVIERGVTDADGDIALGQLRIVNVPEIGAITGVVLLNQEYL